MKEELRVYELRVYVLKEIERLGWPSRVLNDVDKLIQTDLVEVRPRMKDEALSLHGTLSIRYHRTQYNIPVELLLNPRLEFRREGWFGWRPKRGWRLHDVDFIPGKSDDSRELSSSVVAWTRRGPDLYEETPLHTVAFLEAVVFLMLKYGLDQTPEGRLDYNERRGAGIRQRSWILDRSSAKLAGSLRVSVMSPVPSNGSPIAESLTSL